MKTGRSEWGAASGRVSDLRRRGPLAMAGIMHRTGWLLTIVAFLAASATRADFTEFEDRPFQNPGGSEETSLTGPQPLPEGGALFRTAYPSGVKLVRGSLDAGDVDVAEIQLLAGELLLATVFDDDSGAGLDPVLGVFSGGALPTLAVDDDGGRGFGARLGLAATSAGAFQIAVSGFGDSAFDGTHGEAAGAIAPYDLVLAVVSDPADVQESDLSPGPQGHNDVLASADLLPRNGAAVGASLLPGDVDYYAIDLEEGDRIFVSVYDLRTSSFEFASGETNDPVLALFDQTDTLVSGATDDDAGASGFVPSRAFSVPMGQTGRWSIAVSGFGDGAFDGTHDEGPFDYVLVVGRDRACPNVTDLISGIGASTANAYVKAPLQGGDHYYTDRTGEQRHVLVDVPEAIECGQWIKTANNDKNVGTDPHLTFTLAQDASVYIGYDTRATGEPAWLAADFTPRGQLIDILDSDFSQEFNLLRRDFEAGPVELGGNLAPGAGSNYVVVAVPIDPSEPEEAFALPASIPNGILRVTINGVVVQIPVLDSQSPAQVADALAAAVNANPALQSARIFGLGSGDNFVTTGTLESFAFAAQVPTGGGWLLALALLTIGALASARRLSA